MCQRSEVVSENWILKRIRGTIWIRYKTVINNTVLRWIRVSSSGTSYYLNQLCCWLICSNRISFRKRRLDPRLVLQQRNMYRSIRWSNCGQLELGLMRIILVLMTILILVWDRYKKLASTIILALYYSQVVVFSLPNREV